MRQLERWAVPGGGADLVCHHEGCGLHPEDSGACMSMASELGHLHLCLIKK